MFTLFEPTHNYGRGKQDGLPEKVTKQEMLRIFSQELQRGERQNTPPPVGSWSKFKARVMVARVLRNRIQ